MSQVKLAEALLRRKELQSRLERMKQIDNRNLYEVQAKRVKVTDSIDDLTLAVPKMTYGQFDAERNHYAKQLRLIDAAIQQANWTTELSVGDAMNDYEAPAVASAA